MEIIPYTLGVVLFTFAVYWSAANAAAKPGTPVFGLFRFRETRRKPVEQATGSTARRRGLMPGKDAPLPAEVGRVGAARGDAPRRTVRR